MQIKIKTDKFEFKAILDESETAKAIYESLPLKAKGFRWGGEIYFSIPVHVEYENPKEIVNKGDLAFWPHGDAFCIFFGKTPASLEKEIRPASAVNIFGKIDGSLDNLNLVKDGETILVERD
ncbi:MAG: cyclophilin-like fold protein [Methanofastidiosum sp.]|jgi:hypothetical protein|nr:cyclophilin-like fold protein [Methanofastidiosum sp.]